ncbi:MAG: hypothetical protein SPK75_04150 [Victivallales bacterium]|nr:hypothetical protein [Victivallales bacterium]
MVPSIGEGFTAAWRKMKERLWPFNWSTWLVLSLGFWLAQLGEGGASLSMPFNPGDGGDVAGRLTTGVQSAADAIGTTVAMFLLILLSVVFLFSLVIGLILLWVRSRARFVTLDMMLRGVEADSFGARWTRFARQGNSYFLTQILLFVFLLFLGFAFVAFMGFAAAMSLGENRGAFSAGLLIGAGIVFGFFCILAWIYLHLYQDYGAVLMYRSGCSGSEAIQALNRALFSKPGVFVRYLLGLFVIVMLVSLAVGVFSCLTCCMGAMLLAIPFVGTIVLLPTFVFRWQFMLEFFDNGEMLNR